VDRPHRPFKFWTMAVTSVLATLVGLALAVLGDTAEQRLIGVALALFAGLAPAPYILGPLLSGSGPGTVLCGRVRTSAGSETAFVFPTPRAKRIATLARAVGVAGGCAALLAAAGGWVLIVVTALAAVYLGFALAGRARQRLVLTPTRVVLAGPLTTVELPWKAIDEVEIFETRPSNGTTADMLGVTATDPDAVLWTRGERLGRLARGVTDYDICVGADSFAGTGEDVVHAIRRYIHDRDRRRRIGSQEELAGLHRLLDLAGRT
jgi:hypothetical protein